MTFVADINARGVEVQSPINPGGHFQVAVRRTSLHTAAWGRIRGQKQRSRCCNQI